MKLLSLISSCILISILNLSFGQTSLPYSNNFDSTGDTIGWSHYALSGIDCWELGAPTGILLNSSYTSPNAWGTNLDGSAHGSLSCLETPYFDFSDTSKSYVFSFFHIYSINGYANIELSRDSGQVWETLDAPPNQKLNWYYQTNPNTGAGCWSYNNYLFYRYSGIILDTLKGEPSVKFRFKIESTTDEGWVIDQFSISENLPNISLIPSNPIEISKYCSTFDIDLKSTVVGFPTDSVSQNLVKFYWSSDSIFSNNDSLIGSIQHSIGSLITSNNWMGTANISQPKTFTLPNNVNSGEYFLFCQTDADSSVTETNEIDNWITIKIIVDTVHNIPLISHFDDTNTLWKSIGHDWLLTSGNKIDFEGTHSGINAWCIFNTDKFDPNYIISPRLDLSQSDSTVISFWYKLKKDLNNMPYYTPITYSINCSNAEANVSYIPKMRDNTWDFYNTYLPQHADTGKDVRIRIYNGSKYTGGSGYNGNDMIIDDIYIGKAKADLSIERKSPYLFSSSTNQNYTLKYLLCNSGLKHAFQSTTTFYWSSDSILNQGDIILGSQLETPLNAETKSWINFNFTKPTSTPGKYYIFYTLDTGNVIDEMREYNNIDYFEIHIETPHLFPYFNDFETQITDWKHNSSLNEDEWKWTTPNGSVLDTAFSGTKAWITNDTGIIEESSRMHLYTPTFDLSNSNSPVIEIDMKVHRENTNMNYSVDGGNTWHLLDTTSLSFNRWYYPMKYENGKDKYINPSPITNSSPYPETCGRSFASYLLYNGRDTKRNTKYILDIGFLAGQPEVQFRFNVTNLDLVHYDTEGALIDNFSIREAFIDLNIDYKQALMQSSISNQIKFFMTVKNEGNYISNPTTIHYYTSIDSILDSSDVLIGSTNIPQIQPDMYHYTNESFNTHNSYKNHKYLIYKIDKQNTNIESNEFNNIGYWPLALDSINSYPYLNTFNDTVIDGWYHISYDPYTSQKGSYRFRNILAPAEVTYQRDIHSGQMFSDIDDNYPNLKASLMYLESPSFNFSGFNKIKLSFDLMCSGRNGVNYKDGGNLQFSTNGGVSWQTLTAAHGQASNWYNASSLIGLFGQPGWTEQPINSHTANFKPRWIDISFLKNKKHVVFRFQYKSNYDFYGAGTPEGLRIDNFRIDASYSDYVANDLMVPISASLSQNNFNVNYSISNVGQNNGPATTTKFYWSTDSIIDSGDQMILDFNESSIAVGQTNNSIASISYPTPVLQFDYFLFYKVDSNNDLTESNENNNIGSFKVSFDTISNIHKIEKLKYIQLYTFDHTLILNTSSIINNPCFLKLINSTGQTILQKEILLKQGMNEIQLPNSISTGVYITTLQNNGEIITHKMVIR